MTTDGTPKIYLCSFANTGWAPDLSSVAIAEDGTFLEAHISSSEGWAKRDMESGSKQAKYLEHYPDGYELVWVEEIPADVMDRNHALYPEPSP